MEEMSWWNLWNTSYRTNDNNDDTSAELFRRTASLINGITRTRNNRILEIGCGAGTLSRMLVYSYYQGVDLSPAAIDIARKKAEQLTISLTACPPRYEAADFHEWAPPVEGFDVAVCVDAIAYFRDQLYTLKKIATSLRPGGHLVLTTINPFVYDRIQRTPWVRLESGPVSHCLSRQALLSLVREAGFLIEQTHTIMPRGNIGVLRLVNSPRLNNALGPSLAAVFHHMKEIMGLGQYRLVVARKPN